MDLDARLAKLTSRPNEMEAAIVVAALQDAGILATVTGTYTSGFRAEAPGWVQILVAEDDLARAQAILAEIGQDDTEIDWSQIDVGEPEE